MGHVAARHGVLFEYSYELKGMAPVGERSGIADAILDQMARSLQVDVDEYLKLLPKRRQHMCQEFEALMATLPED